MPTIVLDIVSEFAEQGADYAELTTAQKDCVSMKISKLVDEGVPQKQAIAIAIEKCAPESARSSKSSSITYSALPDREPLASVKPPIPGGEYRAKQNPDGTWNVYNVPVFASHSRTFTDAKGNVETKTVDKPWMMKAQARGERRILEDSFLPPLHIKHHGYGVDTRRAGHFRLREVRQMHYEGQLRWMAFADYIAIPDFVYEMMRRGELPYCSVEIHDMDDPEINSVALLETEVPFFRLPLMTIGKEAPVSEAQRFETSGSPAVAYRSTGTNGELALFRFTQEAIMKIIRKKYADLTEDDQKKIIEGKAKFEDMDKDENKDKKAGTFDDHADDDEKKKEEKLQDDGQVAPPAPVAPAPEPAAPQMTCEDLAKMISALPAKIAQAMRVAPPSSEEVPSDIQASATGATKTDAVNYSLKEDVETLKGQRATDQFISGARAKATPYGVDVDKLEKKLRAEIKQYGVNGGERWLEAYLEDKEIDPPTQWEGDLDQVVVDGLPDEVKKFVNSGDPNAAAKAIFYSKEFDVLEARGEACTNKEEYIRDNIAYDARVAKESAERETQPA